MDQQRRVGDGRKRAKGNEDRLLALDRLSALTLKLLELIFLKVDLPGLLCLQAVSTQFFDLIRSHQFMLKYNRTQAFSWSIIHTCVDVGPNLGSLLLIRNCDQKRRYKFNLSAVLTRFFKDEVGHVSLLGSSGSLVLIHYSLNKDSSMRLLVVNLCNGQLYEVPAPPVIDSGYIPFYHMDTSRFEILNQPEPSFLFKISYVGVGNNNVPTYCFFDSSNGTRVWTVQVARQNESLPPFNPKGGDLVVSRVPGYSFCMGIDGPLYARRPDFDVGSSDFSLGADVLTPAYGMRVVLALHTGTEGWAVLLVLNTKTTLPASRICTLKTLRLLKLRNDWKTFELISSFTPNPTIDVLNAPEVAVQKIGNKVIVAFMTNQFADNCLVRLVFDVSTGMWGDPMLDCFPHIGAASRPVITTKLTLGSIQTLEAVKPKAYPLADQFTGEVFYCVQKAASSNQLTKGAGEVKRTLNNGMAELVVLAADAKPFEAIIHLVLLAKDKNVPYVFVPLRKMLGRACQCGLEAVVACSLTSNEGSQLRSHIQQLKGSLQLLTRKQKFRDSV